MCTIDWGNSAEWAGAIATFAVVLVALFQNPFIGWRSRPQLRASFRLKAPDCQKMQLPAPVPAPVASLPKFVGPPHVHAYYFRLWIYNQGKTRAEQVQVFATELLKEALDGSLHKVNNFLPMNLTWAHLRDSRVEVFAEGLSNGMGRHCDLGFIVEPGSNASFNVHVNADECALLLTLESGYFMIDKGIHHLKIRVAAANCAPMEQTVVIRLSGKWFGDETDMFDKGIAIVME